MPRISITLPPITITKDGGVISPVSLSTINVSSGNYAVGVRYSDDSIKLLANEQLSEIYLCDDDGMATFNAPQDCKNPGIVIGRESGNIPQGYALIPYSAYIDSCKLNGDTITGSFIIKVENTNFVSAGLSVEASEPFTKYLSTFVVQGI